MSSSAIIVEGRVTANAPSYDNTAAGDPRSLSLDKGGALRVTERPTGESASNLISATKTATTTSALEMFAAQGAGVRSYITSVIVGNANTTGVGVMVSIMDGSAPKANFPAAANHGGAAIPLPEPIQMTANTAVNAVISANCSTVHVTLVGYKGP